MSTVIYRFLTVTKWYNTPYIYYASPPLEVNFYDQFWITAILPNGKKLSGYTRIPPPFTPTYSFPFIGGITIDSAMVQISEGDPDKKNYKIISIIFEMTEFDHELSNYYSSTHGYLDNFSLRLDETIYSNVNGGIGIIGSKVFTSISFTVRSDYLSLFGYRH